MRIRKLRLRELHMRLVTPFQISVGTRTCGAFCWWRRMSTA